MTKIKQYELDSTIHEDDKVIGTDGNPGVDLGRTKNFTIAALTAYLNTALEVDDMVGGSGTLNTIPMWTPDGTTLGDSIMVKDASVPAPDNGIVVKGKFRIDTTGTVTDVGSIAAFSNTIVFNKDLELNAGLKDYSDSLGTSGQVLTSTGTAVSWVDVSSLSGNVDGSGTLNTIPIWTPDGNTLGDSVLTYDAPNTAITLTGKLVVTNTTNIQGNLTTEAGLTVNTTLADGSGSFGTSGQILSSTGTATQWINNTVIPTNNIVGSGTQYKLPVWDGTQLLGDSQVIQGPQLSDGTYSFKVDACAQFVIDKPSSAAGSGDPQFVIQQNTVDKVSIGWDDDGGGFAFLYNNSGGGIKLGAAGNNPILEIDTATPELISSSQHRFTDAADFEGQVFLRDELLDGSQLPGTAGQLLSSTGTVTQWVDAVDTTYTYSSAQDGSDVVLTLTDGTTPQDIQIVAGNSISLTDNGNNEFTIAATGGAANTTYDLASSQNGSNVDVTLTGTDATTDTVSLVAGTNIVLTDDASNNITVATASDVVTGSGTLNTIPLWTPDGQTLGDSNITVDANSNVTITGSGGASTEELKVVGINSRIVIESSSAGDAYLDFRPNITSNHAAVFELTSSDSSRHFVWEENGNELMRLNGGNQNLGIGTTSPMFPLTVNGAIAAEGTGKIFNYGTLLYTNMNGTGDGVFRVYGNTAGSNYFDVTVNADTTSFVYGSANINLNSGNVGIGTATPSETLHVDGDVRFTGALYASDNDKGNSGQVLISTGTGTDWIDASDLTDNVSGSGTVGKIPYWNPDGTTLQDSLITQTSENSITIGIGATATGEEAISLSRSTARADYSFAHGYESITDGEFSVTLGKGGYTAGDHSAAIGYKGISLGQSAISGGHSSSAGGDGAVALGHNASAGNYGVAKATSTFPNDQTTFDIYGIVGTVAVGTFLRYGPGFDVADPRIEVTQFTDLGNGSATITLASGIRPIQGELLVFEELTPQRNDHQGGVALGNDAFSLGQGAVALGQDAVASADFAVAIGKGATTSTQDTIAMGGDSTKILIEALVSASSYADDTAAAAGGVAIGELYRNGNVVQIRLT